MSERVGLVICREAAIYDLGPQHPLKPDRVFNTWDLIEAYGLDRRDNVKRLGCRPATDAEILRVHTPEFVQATKDAGHGIPGDYGRFGYGWGDNPVFADMHEAGALVAGATLTAAEAVWTADVEHAFNAAGGLHHAMPGRASGFCVYNDPAVAIAWLLDRGAERVAYVDIDVHHGDGVEEIFRREERILTISIHEYGSLFPGTGGETQSATVVNVPVPAGAGDDEWLDAFEREIPPRIRAFEPDILVTQLGADGHLLDPLANLRLTTAAYRKAYSELHRLAHEAAGGRWVATGGGGYRFARVVPRAWTMAFAEMCGAEISDAIPESWVSRESGRRRGAFPATLSDAWLDGLGTPPDPFDG